MTRASLSLAVTEPDGLSANLEALVIRPDGPGPFPLAVLTHGMPRAFFGPEVARKMFDAYADGGPPSWLLIAPDIGHDGHNLIFAPPDQNWWPYVAAFLVILGLPTTPAIPLTPPGNLPDPVPLDAAGRKAFAAYTQSWTYEKAFAVDADGPYGVAYGQPGINQATIAALNDCQRLHRVCRVYAAGNALMPPH